MNTTEDALVTRSLAYLPGIYEATVAPTPTDAGDEREVGLLQVRPDEGGDALPAVIDTIDAGFSRIEQIIDSLSRYFDPWTAPTQPMTQRSVSAETDENFLAWLGTWVGVENLDEVDTARTEPDALEQRQRQLLKHAAELYRRRGTGAGLQALLKAFFDIEVEIHEWTAPAGMRIGVTSAIGIDSVLMPDTRLERSFVVVWHAPAELCAGLEIWRIPARRRCGTADGWIVATVIRAQEHVFERAGRAESIQHDRARWWDVRKNDWIAESESEDEMGMSGVPAGRWDDETKRWISPRGAGHWVDHKRWEESVRLRTKAQRISRAIERERPVHTHYYLALAWEESSRPTDAFTVETSSRIGMTVIEPMG